MLLQIVALNDSYKCRKKQTYTRAHKIDHKADKLAVLHNLLFHSRGECGGPVCHHGVNKYPCELQQSHGDRNIGLVYLIILAPFRNKKDDHHEEQIIYDGPSDERLVIILSHI